MSGNYSDPFLSHLHKEGEYLCSDPRHNPGQNWLFCGTDSSAEDAAVIYSMMACCKAANVDFRQWLVFFLNNVHQYDEDLNMDLADLLPYKFKNSNTKSE